MTPAKDILIVDDEVGIRELLSEILQEEGYRVSLAENATAARAYRSREQPALVLLDIWMPDTDGVTLLARMGGVGPADDAGRDDVGSRDDRDRRRGDEDRRLRFSREAGRVAEAPRHGVACAQDGVREGAAADLARGARHEPGGARRRAPARAAARRAQADPYPRRTGYRTRRGESRRAHSRHGARCPAERRAPRGESACAARGGARRHALLRGDRSIHEGRAAGARVPAAQARQGERHPRVHQHRAPGKPRRRGQVRRGAARGVVGGRGAASAAARAARGHSRADRSLLGGSRCAGAHCAAGRSAA